MIQRWIARTKNIKAISWQNKEVPPSWPICCTGPVWTTSGQGLRNWESPDSPASLTTCWLCHHHHIPYFFQKLTPSTFCPCRPISRHLRAPLVIEEPRGRTGCFPAKVLGWGRPALNCPKKLRPADGEYRSLLPSCLPGLPRGPNCIRVGQGGRWEGAVVKGTTRLRLACLLHSSSFLELNVISRILYIAK